MTERRIQLTPEMDNVIDQVVASRPDGPTKEQLLKRAGAVLECLVQQDNIQPQPTEQGEN